MPKPVATHQASPRRLPEALLGVLWPISAADDTEKWLLLLPARCNVRTTKQRAGQSGNHRFHSLCSQLLSR